MALSDVLPLFKYESYWNDDQYSFYEITISEPSPHFIKHPKQLEEFSRIYRILLNQIFANLGNECEILIMPAIPVSFAVESGRALIPTKDPKITYCQFYKDQGFKPVLRIN